MVANVICISTMALMCTNLVYHSQYVILFKSQLIWGVSKIVKFGFGQAMLQHR